MSTFTAHAHATREVTWINGAVHNVALYLIPAHLRSEAGHLPVIVLVALHITLIPAASSMRICIAHLHAAGLPQSKFLHLVLHCHHHTVAVATHHPSHHKNVAGTTRAEDTTAATNQHAKDASAHHQNMGAPPVKAPTSQACRRHSPNLRCSMRKGHSMSSSRVGNVAGVTTGARAEGSRDRQKWTGREIGETRARALMVARTWPSLLAKKTMSFSSSSEPESLSKRLTEASMRPEVGKEGAMRAT
ncbi:hypothetical protein EI94DRAFT_1792444 [Lactarius quietus]|nr:hypothetical protein EI94DRAFT_1792444 [Lactarius quietus]